MIVNYLLILLHIFAVFAHSCYDFAIQSGVLPIEYKAICINVYLKNTETN